MSEQREYWDPERDSVQAHQVGPTWRSFVYALPHYGDPAEERRVREIIESRIVGEQRRLVIGGH